MKLFRYFWKKQKTKNQQTKKLFYKSVWHETPAVHKSHWRLHHWDFCYRASTRKQTLLYLSASQNSQEISTNDSLLKNVRFLLNSQEPNFLGNWQWILLHGFHYPSLIRNPYLSLRAFQFISYKQRGVPFRELIHTSVTQNKHEQQNGVK